MPSSHACLLCVWILDCVHCHIKCWFSNFEKSQEDPIAGAIEAIVAETVANIVHAPGKDILQRPPTRYVS